MNKKGLLIDVISIAIIIGVVASISVPSSETVNLDMGRTHGTISTAMGSPILGDPSAPITIVEFGDYQCHQCFNWFHDTKPAIEREYIETGKANLVFVDLAFLGNIYWKVATSVVTRLESLGCGLQNRMSIDLTHTGLYFMIVNVGLFFIMTAWFFILKVIILPFG